MYFYLFLGFTLPLMFTINLLNIFIYFIYYVYSRDPVTVYGDLKTALKSDGFEINMMKAVDKDNIVIEHKGRRFNVKNEDEGKLEEMLGSLKNDSLNFDIKEAVKNIEKMKDETFEEEIYKGKISFMVFFVKELIEINGNMKIYVSTDEKLAEELNVPFPGYYGFNAKENAYYKKEFTTVENALSVVNTPILDMVSQENLQYYEECGLPVFYLFHQEFENMKELRTYAYSIREQIKIGLIPYDDEKSNIKYFGITKESLPAMVFIGENKKYKKENTHNLDTIKEFINDYFNNKLIAFENSGEPPADNNERNIKIIVRKEWNEFKNGAIKKDRLLIFHSPYCSFCVQLMPILEKLGERIDKNKVEIGTVNMLENDMPEYKIEYFPTIMLIKANTNEEVVYSSTDRTEKALAEFIGHGNNKAVIEIPEETEIKDEGGMKGETEIKEEGKEEAEIKEDEEKTETKEDL
ncbi:Protein disulfide isomerase [Spraguea lophii 42_110]|uniref:protein disulfide-isomerase n=1 Tax=Spraguea lophii (strain 42_110) TaxID=1358809 RepID=S7XI77_SPRLO|nr:Protein disulfide isomerase [Spraguea lophii 42_110]